MSKWIPDRKVWAGGVAGLLVWALTQVLATRGIVLPVDLQVWLVGGIGWLVAYLMPPSVRDIIKRLDDQLVKMAQDDPTIPVTKPPGK